MKWLMMILMMVALPVSVFADEPATEQAEPTNEKLIEITEEDAEVSGVAVLVVHGMGCPLCANNVDKQLLRNKAIESAKIDLGKGEIRIELKDDGKVKRKDLHNVIEDAGYTLKQVFKVEKTDQE